MAAWWRLWVLVNDILLQTRDTCRKIRRWGWQGWVDAGTKIKHWETSMALTFWMSCCSNVLAAVQEENKRFQRLHSKAGWLSFSSFGAFMSLWPLWVREIRHLFLETEMEFKPNYKFNIWSPWFNHILFFFPLLPPFLWLFIWSTSLSFCMSAHITDPSPL